MEFVTNAFEGLVIGWVLALLAVWGVREFSLSWTWTLFPAGLGTFLVWGAGISESWSFTVFFGGVFTARWAYRAERNDM
ncbi:MAG: hypothetical protein WBD55_07195, partial [Dehalococcoidia bacterium]